MKIIHFCANESKFVILTFKVPRRFSLFRHFHLAHFMNGAFWFWLAQFYITCWANFHGINFNLWCWPLKSVKTPSLGLVPRRFSLFRYFRLAHFLNGAFWFWLVQLYIICCADFNGVNFNLFYEFLKSVRSSGFGLGPWAFQPFSNSSLKRSWFCLEYPKLLRVDWRTASSQRQLCCLIDFQVVIGTRKA